MKNIIFIIIGLVITNNYQIISQDILWKKNFGLNSADDFGQSVIETNDGGIAIAGYTGSYGAGGNDIWLIKTTREGDTLWTKTYGESGDDMAFVVKQTEDGGYIIAGATESFNSNGMLDGCLIKTDEFGNKEWVKVYGTSHDDFFYSLEITDDGGYILTGESDAYPEGDSDVLIVKTDSSGQIEWEKSYGVDTEDERAYNIKQTSTGDYILGGQKGCSGFGGCDAWLLKLNSSGDTLWTKKFHTPSWSSSFRSIIEVNNSEYVMTGLHWVTGEYWNVWLLKTDSLGNVEWEKTYDYQNDYDIGYSVYQSSDGGYIVCGGASPPDIEERGWIIKTDSFGDTLWTKFIGSYTTANPIGSSASTHCYSVIQAQNGDYIVAGAQTQISFQKEVMLLRISSDIVPVELQSFTITVTRNSVSLNWQTATETNNSGFEIERTLIPNPFSKGEGTFEAIGFVPGFGTTTELKSYSFIDENLSAGIYQYRLKQIDFDGSFEYSNTVEVEVMVTKDYSLSQNYPNPFNPATLISFSIPNDEFVSLRIYDVLGREVAQIINERRSAGTHQVEFNGTALNSGVYYYTLTAGSYTETKKMMMVK